MSMRRPSPPVNTTLGSADGPFRRKTVVSGQGSGGQYSIAGSLQWVSLMHSHNEAPKILRRVFYWPLITGH